MQDYANKRQIALNLLRAAARIARECGKEDVAQEMLNEVSHLERGELNAVVCGEAKRGKSSLIEALLQEAGICPVDAPVATNCATFLRYGAQERILAHFEDGKRMFSKEIRREEIADYVTEKGNQGNQRNVRLLEIWLDNPKLASGLVLIDTPGVGSLNVNHAAVTYEAIPYSDAVLFVGSATEPLNEHELKFAQERLGKHAKRLMYVLAKSDLVENASERLQEDLELLEQALHAAEQGIVIPGVATSSKLGMRFASNQNPQTRERSGFPELEQKLNLLLAEREEILLGRAQGRLLSTLAQLRLPLEAERAGLEAKSVEALEAIQGELKAKIARADVLSSDSADWIADLQAELQKLQASCSTKLNTQLDELSHNLPHYLQITEYIQSPSRLGEQLSAECNDCVAEITRDIERELKKIVTKLVNTTSLSLGDTEAELKKIVATLKETTAPAIEPGQLTVDAPHLRTTLPSSGHSVLRKTSDVFRSSVMNATGLAAAGSFAGGLIGGVVGIFGGPVGILGGIAAGAELGGTLGGIMGGIFGIKRGLEEQAERDLAHLRQNLGTEARRHLSRAQREMQNGLQNLFISLRSQIQKDLAHKIRADRNSCAEAVAAMEKAKQARQSDFSAKLLILVNRTKHMGHLAQEAGKLTGEEPPADAASAAA